MKSSIQRLCLNLLLATACVASLSACFPVVLGGAMMGGLVAVDRRTAGTQLEDEGIELRANSRVRDNLGDRGHINITSYNRQVLLTGEVPSAQDKQLVEQVVSQVANVRVIVNELAVLGNTTLTQRTSDTLTTGRVKAGLVDEKELYASAFKVVTERGTTYLMGRVTQREAELATEVVRGTSGVQKVVRVLEIISDAELQSLLPKPAANEVKQ
jgi:osmotically-inducible protein OsmY